VPIGFPEAGAPFRFRMKDKGVETVTAVCAAQASGGDRIQHDFTKNQFTPVSNYATTLARLVSRRDQASGALITTIRDRRPAPVTKVACTCGRS
jgi:hypothetical protein